MNFFEIFCWMTSEPQSSSNHGWVIDSVAVLVKSSEFSSPATSRSTCSFHVNQNAKRRNPQKAYLVVDNMVVQRSHCDAEQSAPVRRTTQQITYWSCRG